MQYNGLGYGAGSMRSVFGGVRVHSRRAVHVLVRVDCGRRSTVIKSTILLSTSLHVGARLPKVRFDAGEHSLV
jgi:hypothetical protein